MRIFLIYPDRESGPHSIDDVRDQIDLRMIAPSQPCRIARRPGEFVAGEIVTGSLFAAWAEEEEDVENEEDEDAWTVERGVVDEEDAFSRARQAPQKRVETLPQPVKQTVKLAEQEEIEDSMDTTDEAEEFGPEDTILWHGHPGYGAFPMHILLMLWLFAGTIWAWFAEWSGWLAVGLGAAFCFSLALLMARRHGTRYLLCTHHLEITRGLWFPSSREIPRHAVQALDIRRPFPSALWGRGDLVITFNNGSSESQKVILKRIFRPGRVRRYWRA